MDNDNIQTNNFTDVAVAISLPIPQGDILQLQVEQSHYTFYLNQQIVEQIQQAKITGISLEIPPKLLLSLWYYACFNSSFVPVSKGQDNNNKSLTKSYTFFVVNILKAFWHKFLQKNITLAAGFTFTSCYQREELSVADPLQEDCILQSVVLFHGDILHKIKRDFLQYNLDSQKIISAHYWLTEQILAGLRSSLNLLVWELSSLVTSVFLTWNIFDLNIPYLRRNIITFILVLLFLTISIASSRSLFANRLREDKSINNQYWHRLSWWISTILPTISLIIFNIGREKIYISTVLLSLITPLMPIVAKLSLNFILPRLGRFVVRRLI
ncbi:hypothetical protein [Anabaena azotica]|uniref:Uncharacterized protein n=1 Tax=Anabaena azotica FACHB-119 TaxID=947527 RepID=A0ABR8CWX1_9NOST|nr:hypothetical protein [Anabaena azotica]MBD2499439.1 hypothetical protein [Anabaena azotica FACHB-119]